MAPAISRPKHEAVSAPHNGSGDNLRGSPTAKYQHDAVAPMRSFTHRRWCRVRFIPWFCSAPLTVERTSFLTMAPSNPLRQNPLSMLREMANLPHHYSYNRSPQHRALAGRRDEVETGKHCRETTKQC